LTGGDPHLDIIPLDLGRPRLPVLSKRASPPTRATSTVGPPRRPSRAGGWLPLVELDPNARTPLYEQIYLAVQQHILAGQLRPGARLASTRALALELKVSRFTIVNALDRLLAEGYLVARRGAGTFVVDTLPESRMRPSRRPSIASANPSRPPDQAPALSGRGQALSSVVITGPRRDQDEPRPFRPRRPPLDVFPLGLWARLIRRQWATYRLPNLDYGEPAGYRPLREAIAAHVGVTRGIRCTADQVIVTSGAQQAFDILFRLLLDPGDQAWIEDPGYLDVRAALIGAGANLVPVPVDRDGINVTEGVRLAKGARLAVVTPSNQYPTGAILSATRRAALLEWARGAGAWIVEDDYDSYFRYRGRPMSALRTLDYAEAAARRSDPRVLYVSTFSKTMFPSLRLGFCVVPDTLVDAVANARAVADRNSPIADQAALAEFIAAGHYDRHLRRVRLVCQERYESMQFHFHRVLDGAVTLSPASAGTHVVGIVDRDRRAAGREQSFAPAIAAAAGADDLVVFRLSRYCLAPPRQDALVLGYGGLTPERIAWGVERLARSIDRVFKRHSRGRR
jgi:GntR family transcriptional regulator/MocR family aminotransferase